MGKKDSDGSEKSETKRKVEASKVQAIDKVSDKEKSGTKFKVEASKVQATDKESDTESVKKTKKDIKEVVQNDLAEWTDDLDKMIDEFKGREKDLLKALRIKAEAKKKEKEVKRKEWYRSRIRSIIEESFPDMVGNMDHMLKEFEGKEKQLFSALKFKSQK